jgi:KDO2-lipid IV(A) lauroyltransferase
MNHPAPPTEAQLQSIRASRLRRVERARRRGPGKRLGYLLQAAIGFTLVGILRLMSVDRASALAGWAGRRVFARWMGGPKVARTMRVPFPDLSEADEAALVSQMSDNVLRVFAELAHLRAFSGEGNERLRITGVENLEAARAAGHGVLVLAGHFGNWEMSEIALRNLGVDGAVSIMPPTNPYVFEWLARQRLAVGLGEQIGAGEGVYRTFRKRLREGKAVLLLADQRVGNGIKAPFFGVETTTNVIPARLARTLGVAVLPMSIRRVAGPRVAFDIAFLAPLEVETTGNNDHDDKAFTARMNAFYERELLAVPGQWLWGHPRWDDALFNIKTKRDRRAAKPDPKGG